LIGMEAFAVIKRPGYGKCKNSSFADGQHRAGLIPVWSALDGGLPGCSSKWFCVDCEKPLKREGYFVPMKQPSRIGELLIPPRRED